MTQYMNYQTCGIGKKRIRIEAVIVRQPVNVSNKNYQSERHRSRLLFTGNAERY